MRAGYIDRRMHPIPDGAMIRIIISDSGLEQVYLCHWTLINASNGLLGTARCVSGRLSGIGFHAWQQNESEFIYYQLL